MKKIHFICLVALFYWATLPLYAQDSIQIVLDKETKMLITSPDRASMRKLRYLDINHLVRKAINEKEGEVEPDEENKPKKRLYKLEYEFDYSDEERDKARQKRDSLRKAKGWESRNAWDFSIGTTNYLEKGKFPNNTNKPYGLNSSLLGISYASIACNFVFKFYDKPLSISIGGELSTNIFRFQNNNYIARNAKGDTVSFRNYQDDFQKGLRRSNLSVLYFNIPLQVRLALLKNIHGRKIVEMDFGGSVGYRLASNARIKISGDGSAQNRSDDFLLTNFRYGLEGGLSVHGVRIFGRYDLSSLFANAQMPDLNVLTLGIKLLTLD